MRTRYVLAVMLAIAPLSSQAAIFDKTTELTSACKKVQTYLQATSKNSLEGVEAVACINYLYGFMGGYFYVVTKEICVPQDVTGPQLAAVFVKWAEANPTEWHRPTWQTVRVAFVTSFPCASP